MAHSSTNASLAASVISLRSSLSLLDSSISILDSGISDFPRMKTVLTSTRHFELTPQSSLTTAQAGLQSELAPAIETLISRAETHVAKLERRQQGLVARSELLEGRLSQAGGSGDKTREERKMKEEGNKERVAKIKAVRQKKERLGYAVERLELQSQQRQRQLRTSHWGVIEGKN